MTTNKTLMNLLNGVLFQIGWFSCVLGGNEIAVLATTAILIIHYKLYISMNAEWFLISVVALLGLTIDRALSIFGVLIFEETLIGIPLWLFCIWVLFASSLNHSLYWLNNKLPLAALLGAIAGPSSYYAGSKLSNVSLGAPPEQSLIVLALLWGCLFPLLLLSTRRLNELFDEAS